MLMMLLFGGCTLIVRDNASFSMKSGSINSNCEIYCNEKIEIGSNVIIAPDVIIRDSDAHSINGCDCSQPIIIGDNVWICTRAIILKGVTIGEGSVVAAGTIVTKDVPTFSLVAGNPGKVVKSNIHWKE